MANINELLKQAWVRIAGAAVAAFLAGLGAGILLTDDAREEGDDGEPAAPAANGDVPAVCLEAIEAARTELMLRSEGLDTALRYPDLARRAARAVRDLDTRQLEELLTEFEALNSEMRELVDRATAGEFSSLADDCEAEAV
jgi:hypothetical protein